MVLNKKYIIEEIKRNKIKLNGVSIIFAFACFCSSDNVTENLMSVFGGVLSEFSVAIIPYTYEHTNFHDFEVGTKVNLEFDVIGKYVSKLYSNK